MFVNVKILNKESQCCHCHHITPWVIKGQKDEVNLVHHQKWKMKVLY